MTDKSFFISTLVHDVDVDSMLKVSSTVTVAAAPGLDYPASTTKSERLSTYDRNESSLSARRFLQEFFSFTYQLTGSTKWVN